MCQFHIIVGQHVLFIFPSNHVHPNDDDKCVSSDPPPLMEYKSWETIILNNNSPISGLIFSCRKPCAITSRSIAFVLSSWDDDDDPELGGISFSCTRSPCKVYGQDRTQGWKERWTIKNDQINRSARVPISGWMHCVQGGGGEWSLRQFHTYLMSS